MKFERGGSNPVKAASMHAALRACQCVDQKSCPLIKTVNFLSRRDIAYWYRPVGNSRHHSQRKAGAPDTRYKSEIM